MLRRARITSSNSIVFCLLVVMATHGGSAPGRGGFGRLRRSRSGRWQECSAAAPGLRSGRERRPPALLAPEHRLALLDECPDRFLLVVGAPAHVLRVGLETELLAKLAADPLHHHTLYELHRHGRPARRP